MQNQCLSQYWLSVFTKLKQTRSPSVASYCSKDKDNSWAWITKPRKVWLILISSFSTWLKWIPALCLPASLAFPFQGHVHPSSLKGLFSFHFGYWYFLILRQSSAMHHFNEAFPNFLINQLSLSLISTHSQVCSSFLSWIFLFVGVTIGWQFAAPNRLYIVQYSIPNA